VALPTNFIDTARLILRVPGLSGAEALMGIIWDPEVVEQKQVTLREPPRGLELAVKNTNDMIRQWQLRGYGQWSVGTRRSTVSSASSARTIIARCGLPQRLVSVSSEPASTP
jgi:hypothetical protein